jgi:hypothetical protein
MGRHPKHLPIACAGISLRRPVVLVGLVASTMMLWTGIAVLASLIFHA